MANKQLDPDKEYLLQQQRLSAQTWMFGGLLGAVLMLNLSPLFIGFLKRPADNVLANIKETSLLITGALAGSASTFLVGAAAEKSLKGASNTNTNILEPTPPKNETLKEDKRK